MVMLLFPTPDCLRLALTSAAVPPEVADAPAVAMFEPDGAVWVRPSKALPRSARAALARLGARECEPATVGDHEAEAVACWAQILPLTRDPSAETPGPTTPVVFELPGAQVPELVGEVLRLGNDRQSVRWLSEGEGSEARALLRVVGPPYYALLRALDRDDRHGGPRAYLERAPRVLVEVGYTHKLLDRLRPPPGQVVLMGPPRRWEFVAEGPFRDIYEALEFRLPAAEVRRRDVPQPGRITVPLRLARGGASEAAELWVVRDRAVEQLDELVRHADDRLIARLAFAVAESESEGKGEGGPTVVIRARPSKQAPPVLVLDGVGYRPYLRLANLFLPVGSRLHPPLRRDAVARLLASDPARVTWLAPSGVGGGGFVPESMPDEAFRPLDQWVDYVLDREHRPLEAWVRSNRFDFEPFVCDDGDGDDPDRGSKRERKRRKGEDELPDEAPAAPPAPSQPVRARAAKRAPDESPAVAAVEPGEAARRLGDLEARFLALEGPLDAEERRPLWGEMASLNAALERGSDAAVCWANALWETGEPPTDWVEAWARAEAKASGRAIDDAHALEVLLTGPKPAAADVRALAAGLVLAAHAPDRSAWSAGLRARLGRVQHFLERHEGTVPVRVAWLAWSALATLARGDALALARARDRVLERLHAQGLSRDLDLPYFLRFAGGGSGERARLARDHLLRLHEPARAWIKTGPWTGPYTEALADLVFAYGLTRLGDAEAAGRALRSGLAALPKHEPVVGWLGKAFEHRVRQAAEGKPAAGPLPAELMRRLDQMGQAGGEERRKQEKTNRYKIDALRKHSQILEPHERVDPYRHWRGGLTDADRELLKVVDLLDRGELAERMTRLLAARPSGSKPEVATARVVGTALEVSFRLGEPFALGLFDRVLPAVDGLKPGLLEEQAGLLERALRVAAHFDQHGHLRAYVGRFEGLLADADERSAPALEPLLRQCFRGLRKLGLRDEADRLLGRMAGLVLKGRGAGPDGTLAGAAERTGAGAGAWSKALRLLLHVAAGWCYFGQPDRARPVFDEARALLFRGELPPTEQTPLACAYAGSLGHAPPALALPRLEEIFTHLERVHDAFTVGSHYSLSRLGLIEAVVLTMASEDFTLGESGRRWVEDDEYFVRRRVHREVRAALGQEG
jgi:hypothetical protein